MSVFRNSLLLQRRSVFLFDYEVHVDHEGGGVLFEELGHYVVLEAVVEEQGDSGATDEWTSGTLVGFSFRQILKIII